MTESDALFHERPFLAALVTTVAFAVLSGAFSIALGVEYGATLFAVTPLVAGFIAGLYTTTFKAALKSLGASVLLLCFGLLFLGIEGIVCVLMATPLILLAALAGALFAKWFRSAGSGRADRSPPGALLLFGFALVGCSGAVERSFVSEEAEESVVSTQHYDATAEEVWDALIVFQRVEGNKPLLLRLGLPVPLYCTIDGSGVGARRVCHFDQGVIEERVSVWNPPHRLAMQITNVTLPGRDWLRFVDARYDLRTLGDGSTQVRRTTTYTSVLRPRIYWRALEKLGTRTEHDFILNAVTIKLADREG